MITLLIVNLLGCGQWKECYDYNSNSALDNFVLYGKEKKTPTEFTSERSFYSGKDCTGDLLYYEKVHYVFDSVSVKETGYPCTDRTYLLHVDVFSANVTIDSSTVRFGQWQYYEKNVECSAMELNKDYRITYLHRSFFKLVILLVLMNLVWTSLLSTKLL